MSLAVSRISRVARCTSAADGVGMRVSVTRGGGGGWVEAGKLNEQRENDRRVGGEEGAARGRVCHTAGLG